MRWLVAFLVVLAPAIASAQALRPDALDGRSGNALEVRAGADDAFVAEVAYARAVRVLGRAIVVDVQLDLPWVIDARDGRLRGGVALPIAIGRRWYLTPRIAPTLRVTSNEAAGMVGAGVDVGVVGGVYMPHWFLAADVGIDVNLVTHVAPTMEYREQVFEDARDGWYGTLGGELRAGLVGGATFGDNDVALRAGLLVLTDGDPPVLPLYATISYARRW